MKKVHICLFIISLLTPVYWTTAQELLEEIEEVVVDTLKKKEKKTLYHSLWSGSIKARNGSIR
jgi:hypothetical protein